MGTPVRWRTRCKARELVRAKTDQAFASHLVAPAFKAPAVSKAHSLMSRAASIGLMRLAQETPRARGFRTFAFVIHDGSLHPLHKIIDRLFYGGWRLLCSI